MAEYENILKDWPEKSRQACQRVIEKYGAPDEVCNSRMIWHNNGPWKRTEVFRAPIRHNWPMEHDDMVENFLDYRVPPERCSDLARFDGSVMVERTKGEISARCEAEEANFLALNLAHDIITGRRGVMDARAEYARNMASKQTKGLGPYMSGLQFDPADGDTTDPDTATLDAEGNRIREEEEVLQAT